MPQSYLVRSPRLPRAAVYYLSAVILGIPILVYVAHVQDIRYAGDYKRILFARNYWIIPINGRDVPFAYREP